MEVDTLYRFVQTNQLKNYTFDKVKSERRPTSAFLLIIVPLFG